MAFDPLSIQPISSSLAALPDLPRLVLRVGFAGNQKLPSDVSELTTSLGNVFETLARRLAEIAPGPPIYAATTEPWLSRFYSKENPVFRLITGLCEGGDSLAEKALEALKKHPVLHPHVAIELAAVIPFDLPNYRASRMAAFLPDFDRQAASCAYILNLDGIYDKPPEDVPLAKNRRARAYRAQATLLLRQADIIVAASDPDGEVRAGGTIETVRAALDFGLPVVFIHTGTGKISLIEPGVDPISAFSALAAVQEHWTDPLRHWVTTIVEGPGFDGLAARAKTTSSPHATVVSHGEQLLAEFFGTNRAHSSQPKLDEDLRTIFGTGDRPWASFERRFRSGPTPQPDPPLQPYAQWRARSTTLNYLYVGLYRDAFLLNYFLAATAVLLAAVSLVLLGIVNATSRWLFPTLLILGAGKLWCVWWIFRNTHSATHGEWNDKAVDYRYLAERLRTMFYLPRVGCFRLPVAATPHYASRVVRQSAVDWLLNAIVRGISPASLPLAQKETFTFSEGSYDATLVRLDPLALLQDVRDRWLGEQAVYHDRNARTMDRLYTWAENWGKVFNLSVIVFVALDIAILLAELFSVLPETWSHTLHYFTLGLVALAAILPAAVGSLNGIRFQSECRRLAERSAIMRAILAGRAEQSGATQPRNYWQSCVDRLWQRPVAFFRTLFPFVAKPKHATKLDPTGSKLAAADQLLARITAATAKPETNPASWAPDVLRFAESVSDVFMQEVAEWSVLYAKEIPEP